MALVPPAPAAAVAQAEPFSLILEEASSIEDLKALCIYIDIYMREHRTRDHI